MNELDWGLLIWAAVMGLLYWMNKER